MATRACESRGQAIILQGHITNILIVEDQRRIAAFIEQGLRECSYHVVWAASCREAREALSGAPFDAIVLDLGLPDGDGLELLRTWRAADFNEPVLILSARNEVENRIAGLNCGADDYLSKPFSLEELIARLRSLLRRQSTIKIAVLEHRDIVLDLTTHTVLIDGEPAELSRREFALLELFMLNIGRGLPRAMIIEKCWPSDHDHEAKLLDVYMSRLRAKFETGPRVPLFKTLRGFGYQIL